MNRILTEKVKAEMLNAGMDLVGFGPVRRWDNAPYLMSPKAILPECQTVIVGAISISDTWTELGGEPTPHDMGPGGWLDHNTLLDRITYRTVRMLNDNGHKAIGVASSNIWRFREFSDIPSLFAPDLSHIHAAAAAGLAEIGWSGLAITPEFGSRCRFTSIVTNADLVPTPMYDGPPLCDMCGDCIRNCPSMALKKDFNSKKPHVVKIGGKTYKYANKNIWRCAWAEHFDLNLESETLKKDGTINEQTILNEIHSKGKHSHEWGVCQKVCVPPHLRSREPSFGRPDKTISMNRINKRYPDSMPTLRKIRDDISTFAVKQGIDLISFAPLQFNAEISKRLIKEYPGACTVIAFASQVFKEEQQVQENYLYDKAASMTMHHNMIRLVNLIEGYGYSAASYRQGKHCAINEKELAAMTDLGEVENDNFVTPEFGPDQLLGVIVTNAQIDSSNKIHGKLEQSNIRKLTGLKLRRKLENLAAEKLVSMFGAAPVERFIPIVEDLKKNINEKELGETVRDISGFYAHGPWKSEVCHEDIKIRLPEEYVENAKSVIVLGMHLPDEVINNSGLDKNKQIGCYTYHQYQTVAELGFAAYELTLMLRKMGYKAMVCSNMLGVGSKIDSPRGHLPDMRCSSIEAVAAGLGEIGKNGALLTKEHGPHQRCIVIVTDAELPTDEVSSPAKYCRDCKICVDKCPMEALNNECFEVRVGSEIINYPVIKRHRCDWSKRYSLCPQEGPALIGNNTEIKTPEGSISIETLAEACEKKDEIMKTRTCILETCLRQCPRYLDMIAC